MLTKGAALANLVEMVIKHAAQTNRYAWDGISIASVTRAKFRTAFAWMHWYLLDNIHMKMGFTVMAKDTLCFTSFYMIAITGQLVRGIAHFIAPKHCMQQNVSGTRKSVSFSLFLVP